MPDDTWGALAREHGAKVVLSPNITDDELRAETERQAAVIFPLLGSLLNGTEKFVVDFGCGAGRFTGYLADTVRTAITAIGCEPCRELRQTAAKMHPDLIFYPDLSPIPWREAVDVLFVHCVLGEPDIRLTEIAPLLLYYLAPGALLFIVDHMADVQPTHRWWRFRPVSLYQQLFRPIDLRVVGEDRQLDAPITMLAGRKAV